VLQLRPRAHHREAVVVVHVAGGYCAVVGHVSFDNSVGGRRSELAGEGTGRRRDGQVARQLPGYSCCRAAIANDIAAAIDGQATVRPILERDREVEMPGAVKLLLIARRVCTRD